MFKTTSNQYDTLMGLLARADYETPRLAGRRALVIGGSGGIGRSVCYQLADNGAEIICHGGHDRKRLEDTVHYIRSRQGPAQAVLLRIDQARDVYRVIERAGPVDIVVVAFGPISYTSILETDAGEWQRMVELNLILPGMVLSAVLPSMLRRGWGRVVLFGGTRTDSPRAFRTCPAYGAAKSGLASLVRSAAVATSGKNVTVNGVAPGYVDTEYLTDDQRSEFGRRSPQKRLIMPEHVARLVTHVVCAIEPDLNGAMIPFDQGMG